jgi:hypothetical protein
MNIEELKYPIGKFRPVAFTPLVQENVIATIKAFPEKLDVATKNLNDTQLNITYRPDGWSIRQVIHHCADSHMNAFIRFKLALTENNPTIKPYNEAEWAKMNDYNLTIHPSIQLLYSLHSRWIAVLGSMTPEEYNRSYFHPENKSTSTLSNVLQLYSWHSEHHLAHITNLVKREGWAI